MDKMINDLPEKDLEKLVIINNVLARGCILGEEEVLEHLNKHINMGIEKSREELGETVWVRKSATKVEVTPLLWNPPVEASLIKEEEEPEHPDFLHQYGREKND